MEILLIRVACIIVVHFGSISIFVKSLDNQSVTSKSNDESEFRENFQNLFDSIAESDMKRREIYREVLKQEVVRDQQVFNALKEKTRTARNRNSYKKRIVDKNYDIISRRMIANKRQTNENDQALVSQELPETGDNFENIRANNKVFVDKSAYITKLLKRQDKFMRICRPQQFGKSNFLQMLGSFFSANQTQLFEGTKIGENQTWKFNYPVLYFDFHAMNVTSVEAFKADLSSTILRIGQSYGLKIPESDSITSVVQNLINGFSEIRKKPYHAAVILVDEYDWPVRQYVEKNEGELAQTEMREMGDFLQDFFAIFQSLSKKSIRFLFLTCTTPLDLDYYSDGLDVVDITHDPEFKDMIGLTHEELLHSLEPHIEQMAKVTNETFDAIVKKVRNRYNGFCFSPNSNATCGLYSFNSVFSCLRGNNLSSNIWQATGDPKYNIIDHYAKDTHRRNVIKYFSNLTISRIALEKTNHFDYPPSMETCMVLYGYLTYRSYDAVTRSFTVDFPNDEVREKFVKELLEHGQAGKWPIDDVLQKCSQIRDAMTGEKWQTFIQLLNTMICEPESDVTRSKYAYTDRVIRVLQTCDIESQYEYNFYHKNNSQAGTIGLVIKAPNEQKFHYVFEFEWNSTADHALNKLLNFAKIQDFVEDLWSSKVSLIGINFGPNRGEINEWVKVTHEGGVFRTVQRGLRNICQDLIELKVDSFMERSFATLKNLCLSFVSSQYLEYRNLFNEILATTFASPIEESPQFYVETRPGLIAENNETSFLLEFVVDKSASHAMAAIETYRKNFLKHKLDVLCIGINFHYARTKQGNNGTLNCDWMANLYSETGELKRTFPHKKLTFNCS